MNDTSDPDELLGKCAGQPDVGVAEYHGHGKTEGEENNSVGVEAEIVVAVIDTTTVKSLGRSYGSIVSAIILAKFSCHPQSTTRMRKRIYVP